MDRAAMPTRRRVVAAGIAAVFVPLFHRRAAAETTGDGSRILTAKPGEAYVHGAGKPATAIWGYDGTVPGPTLRVKRGEELKMRLVNALAEPTAVHWHGLRIDNRMDGAIGLTQEAIAPGAAFDYRFTPPDASTFWYHPLASEQRGRGLAGLLIIEEAEAMEVDHDAALVLDDWLDDSTHEDRDRNHLTANGVPRVEIPVRANERLRLRLVNAASAASCPCASPITSWW